MGGFSNFYASSVANHFFRGDVSSTVQSRPSELFLALHTTAPTDAGSSNGEISGGSYARQRISFTAPDTDQAATPSGNESDWVTFVSNNATISFVGLPACAINYIGIWTDASAGRLLFSDKIINENSISNSQFIINSGDSFVIPSYSLKVYIQ